MICKASFTIHTSKLFDLSRTILFSCSRKPVEREFLGRAHKEPVELAGLDHIDA